MNAQQEREILCQGKNKERIALSAFFRNSTAEE